MLQQPYELEKGAYAYRALQIAEPIRLVKVVCNFDTGGTEGQVFNLVRRLDLNRFQLEFACLQKRGGFMAEYEKRDIPIHEFPVRSLYDPRTWLRMLSFTAWLRARQVQIVHAYNFYSLMFALPAARLARVPVVLASIRDRGIYLSPLQKRVQRWVCCLADGILVNADSIRDWLLEEGYPAARIQVIKNGIDLNQYQSGGEGLRAELGLPEGAPLVLMVARLNRQKGVEEFIRAAALVAQRHPQARFLVVGRPSSASTRLREDGSSDCRDWEALCRELGLRDRLYFTGHRSDIPRLLAEAAVSVLPSHSEGLSNTLLESMAAGVPIVSTRVGGTPELIEDGHHGLLVPPRDPQALAVAMERILADRELAERLGAQARQKASAEFSLQRMVDRTDAMYVDALGGDGA